MTRDILLLVKDPRVAAMLAQRLNNVEVANYGASLIGRQFRVVLALDVIDNPHTRDWIEKVAKARVAKDGSFIEVGRTQAPLAAAPQAIPKQVRDPSPMPMEIGVEINPPEVPTVVPETETSPFAQPEPKVEEEVAPTPQLTEKVEFPPVDMPVLDEDGKIETDPAIIEAVHRGEE